MRSSARAAAAGVLALAGFALACGVTGEQADLPASGPDGADASPDAGLVDGTPAGDAGDHPSSAPEVLFPRTGITAAELGVIVNDSDPLSVAVASYYVAARKIPAANVVHVQIPNTTASTISEAEFAPLKTQVDAALLGSSVQALALTWTKPYAVANMSITSAFAMGYRAIANGNTCNDPNSQWPAEGIFIGEPLARPFGSGFTSRFANGSLTVETTAMIPKVVYLIEAADSAAGPFSVVLDDLSIPQYRRATFVVPKADRRTYRFRART